MNKTELAAAAAQATGMTKKDSELVLNAALDLIAGALARGEKIQLSGFGNFEIKERQARVGRNPRTGEAVPIAATRTPVFTPSKILKDTVGK